MTRAASSRVVTPTTSPLPARDGQVYREAALQQVCAVCKEPAVARCPDCGQVFCLQHTSSTLVCPDCTLEHARVLNRANGFIAGLLAAGGLSCLSIFCLVSQAHGFFAAAAFLPLWGTLSGILRWTARRKWRAGREAAGLLEGVRIAIAASDGSDASQRPRRHIWVHRPRGETPTPDWGARTYGH